MTDVLNDLNDKDFLFLKTNMIFLFVSLFWTEIVNSYFVWVFNN